MRFGLQIDSWADVPAERLFPAMVETTQHAEELGFESVWYEDHLMFIDDTKPDQPVARMECLTTLAGLAASTVTIGIGALVTCVPFRNPALLAKTWTTLDVISGGRTIVGLGAGWSRTEFDAYGYEFGTTSERFDQLEEAVQIIDRMMTQPVASFSGRRTHIAAARNDPKPLQRPRPPILIGGNGRRRTLRLVARYADLCNVYGSPSDVANLYATLDGHCLEVGRDPRSITRSINYWTSIPDGGDAWVDEELRSLETYAAVGTDLVIVKLLNGFNLAALQRFGSQVLDRFR